MKTEIARRQSNTEKVLALFREQPLTWINATVFMDVAGAMAWRTRISDARKILEAEGGQVENRVRHGVGVDDLSTPIISEYRFVPYIPIARDAGTVVAQKSLF